MIFPTHIVAAGALISNEEGKILLVKNPKRGWEFPGGQVENGEDLFQAIKREVFEESGYNVEIKNLVGVYSNVKSYMGWDNVSFVPTKVIFDFIGTLVSGEARISDESEEVGWFDREEVLKMITVPSLLDRVKVMLNFNGKVVYKAYTTKPSYDVHLEQFI